jgi:hypothetical protein
MPQLLLRLMASQPPGGAPLVRDVKIVRLGPKVNGVNIRMALPPCIAHRHAHSSQRRNERPAIR